MLPDFPKVKCPFVRKHYAVNKDDWKKHGAAMGLREPLVYLVTPEVEPGYEWVLENKDTIAVEKLHGSNLCIETEGGRIKSIQNRRNVVDPYQLKGGKGFLVESVLMAIGKDYVKDDAVQYGEALGPKLNGNMYKLPYHLWYPFDNRKSLQYTSFNKYGRSYDNLGVWFQFHLRSIFYCRFHKLPLMSADAPFAEGVIFYNGTKMAKLRRDMFPWFYQDKIRIEG